MSLFGVIPVDLGLGALCPVRRQGKLEGSTGGCIQMGQDVRDPVPDEFIGSFDCTPPQHGSMSQ